MTTEQSFNVLDRNLCIQESYLLQASAGTGKTFSIENIVIRLLLESKALQLKQILLMTFTKKATSELKSRVREKILLAIEHLRGLENAPDYLQAIIEKGEAEVKRASLALEQALYDFDDAQIFTIHGFCHRSLEEGGKALAQEALEEGQLLALLKDYILHAVRLPKYCPQQLQKLLKEHRMDFQSLLRKLLKLASAQEEILAGQDYQALNDLFWQALQELKEKHPGLKEHLLEDFLKLAPFYKGLCDKNKQPKASFLEQIQFFIELLEKKIPEPLLVEQFLELSWEAFEKIHPDFQKKQKDAPKELPAFFKDFQKTLLPLLKEALDYLQILARLAKDSRSFLQSLFAQKGFFSHDELLKSMSKAVEQKDFCQSLQEKYQAIIVDEFQDTDPLQWKILKRLFLDSVEKKYLYLVGDPKQSIYGFRGADIYTYFEAGKELSKRASLETNYRSEKPLLEALNALFLRAEGFISLPRQETSLPYLQVAAAKESQGQEGAFIECLLLKEKSSRLSKRWPSDPLLLEYYFSYIAAEILQLKEKTSLSSIAVLVRDRFEAKALREYFTNLGIPSKSRDIKLIVDTAAFQAMEDLIRASLEPSSQTNLIKVLAGPLINWPLEELEAFHREKKHSAKVLHFFYSLQDTLLKQGFASFYRSFCQLQLHEEKTVLENLLCQKEGLEIYRDLEDLAEIFVEKSDSLSARGLLRLIDDLREASRLGQENLCLEARGAEDAVEIMTLHVSKGLEFDYVFALGLLRRFFSSKDLTPCLGKDGYYWKVCQEKSPEQQLYEEELNAEKLRQLYVAMTRAKKKLYLPMLFDQNEQEIELAAKSAMELFLKRLGLLSFEQAFEELPKLHPKIAVRLLEKSSCPPQKDTSAPVCLQKPVFLQLKNPESKIASFSSLLHQKKSAPFESVTSQESACLAEKTAYNLPASASTGDFFHQFFETFPFHLAKDYSLEQIINDFQPLLTEALEPWQNVLAEMIRLSLFAPLSIGEKRFSLSDLKEGSYQSELEFLFYQKEEKSYYKGFIDLFFEHEGLYYFLDWKSNHLGPSQEHYQKDCLKAAMEKHHYFLQESLYRQALLRFLQKSEKPFGGSFYMFLRGLQTNTEDGIYAIEAI